MMVRRRRTAEAAVLDEGSFKGNGYDPEKMRHLVAAIEADLYGIDELHSSIASDVAYLRASVGSHYASAKELGIPLKPLKAAIRMRRLAARLLEPQRDELEQLRSELGDLASTPLGGWAQRSFEDGRDARNDTEPGAAAYPAD